MQVLCSTSWHRQLQSTNRLRVGAMDAFLLPFASLCPIGRQVLESTVAVARLWNCKRKQWKQRLRSPKQQLAAPRAPQVESWRAPIYGQHGAHSGVQTPRTCKTVHLQPGALQAHRALQHRRLRAGQWRSRAVLWTAPTRSGLLAEARVRHRTAIARSWGSHIGSCVACWSAAN